MSTPHPPMPSIAECHLCPGHTDWATPHTRPHGEDGRVRMENLTSCAGDKHGVAGGEEEKSQKLPSWPIRCMECSVHFSEGKFVITELGMFPLCARVARAGGCSTLAVSSPGCSPGHLLLPAPTRVGHGAPPSGPAFAVHVPGSKAALTPALGTAL